jgi:transposase
MIQITAQTKVFVAVEPIDFRKGIDGLAALCRQILDKDPFSGALFLFRNRSRNSLKILAYDGQGFWLCTKRLSQGHFSWWPEVVDQRAELQAHELQTLLWNGNLSKASFSREWRKIA